MDLFRRFRKHDLDIINPVITELAVSINKGKPEIMSITSFKCKKCGRFISVVKEQIKDLPSNIARGCPGNKESHGA